MNHPLTFIHKWNRKPVFVALLIWTLVLFAIFQVLNAPLITSAAPFGIVSHQFAWTPEKAQAILASWAGRPSLVRSPRSWPGFPIYPLLRPYGRAGSAAGSRASPQHGGLAEEDWNICHLWRFHWCRVRYPGKHPSGTATSERCCHCPTDASHRSVCQSQIRSLGAGHSLHTGWLAAPQKPLISSTR